jgi:polysaccharide pyruvyl transferase WcaK-like protein
MGLVERSVVFLMVMMVAIKVSNAAVHKVGDSSGWTIIGSIDYKKWAATKNFQIGDTIGKFPSPQISFLNCGKMQANVAYM